MVSYVLTIASRLLLPLLLLYSFFLLLRGHNSPGGGFSGGLVVAGAIILYILGADVAAARRLLSIRPQTLIAVGLALAAGSGLLSVLIGNPFLTGRWLPFTLPVLEGLHLGTPILFDIGVYLTTIGAVLTILIILAENE